MVVVVSDTLGTGDVLLFYNARALISRTIAYFDGTDCSHVAIVVKNPPWGGLPRGVYLLESGYEDFDDVESHVERYGVRLSMIDDVLRAYGSHDIHVRRLVQHPRWTDAALCAAHDLVHGKPYDMDPADWLAFINHETPHPPTDDRYVCSAMVTRVLIKLAVVAPDCNWTFVTPAEYGQRLAELPLVPGARFGSMEGPVIPRPRGQPESLGDWVWRWWHNITPGCHS